MKSEIISILEEEIEEKKEEIRRYEDVLATICEKCDFSHSGDDDMEYYRLSAEITDMKGELETMMDKHCQLQNELALELAKEEI